MAQHAALVAVATPHATPYTLLVATWVAKRKGYPSAARATGWELWRRSQDRDANVPWPGLASQLDAIKQAWTTGQEPRGSIAEDPATVAATAAAAAGTAKPSADMPPSSLQTQRLKAWQAIVCAPLAKQLDREGEKARAARLLVCNIAGWSEDEVPTLALDSWAGRTLVQAASDPCTLSSHAVAEHCSILQHAYQSAQTCWKRALPTYLWALRIERQVPTKPAEGQSALAHGAFLSVLLKQATRELETFPTDEDRRSQVEALQQQLKNTHEAAGPEAPLDADGIDPRWASGFTLQQGGTKAS